MVAGGVKERNDYYPFGARHVKADYPRQAVNRFKYNGKEEQVTGDLGYLDYGARMYDGAIGRWFVNDPLLEKYLSLSSYSYCGNHVVGAIDLGGRLFVFVNGFNLVEYAAHEGRNMSRDLHGLPAERYNPNRDFQRHDFYGWANIDKLYMATCKDDNALYVNGSFEPFSRATERYQAGVQKGMELLTRLRSGSLSLAENETIKIVGYSMGGAYAAGMASVLMKDEEYRKKLEFVDYLAPYQPTQFEHPEGVLGRQYQMKGDWLVDAKKIKRIDELNFFLNDNKWYDDILGGHMLNKSFMNFLQACFNSGIPIYIK
ncbi:MULTISPECIES: RHS repeat domain-containing protein [Butyricimonas]|uniref:RHS repeat domain-containing protein n=1 Tax=Butyricimonas TaxID=574697 RepID=UPI0007FB2219|nr:MULTISPECIES: RHS repeat-associated core domain-containing protein [Butyricimonas]